MKRKNLTRNALFTSVLSLLLCVSMLVGTTFAWFTDEVESGVNTIAAGNLDVELYHGKDANPVDKVKNDTLLFTDVGGNVIDLWEPGVVAFTNLKVANEGTLALKYQLSVNSTEMNYFTDGDGVQHTLAEALKVAVVKGGVSGTREEVVAAASNWTGLESFTLSGVLEADKKSETYGIVIYWEPGDNEVDNQFNMNNGKTTSDGKPLSITLGVNLFATQEMYEDDSFGPDYDKSVWDNAMQVLSAQDLQAAIDAGETAIMLMADIALTETLEIPAGTAVKLNLSGYELSGNKTKDSGAAIVNNGTLSIYGGEMSNNAVNGAAVIENNGSLTLDGVTVKGAPMDSTGYPEYAVVTYGKLTVEEGTAIVADRGAIRTYAGAEVVINGGSFTVSNAADGRNMTIHTIYAYGNGAKLTINDGYFEQNHTSTGGASVICPAGASIDIYGGDFRDAMDDTNWTSTGNFQNYMGYTAPVNVYGGTFDDATVNKNLASGYEAVDNGDGTWSVILPQGSFENLIKNAQPGETVEIPAGTYAFPASAIKAGQTLECAPGTVFEGKSGMDIKGATVIGATFSNPDDVAGAGTINGTFKDCVFEGSETLRWCYAGETVVFENCEFKTDFRGVHFDGMDHDVIFRNCKINGFNAFGGDATVTFEGCTFGCDESKYNGLNLYCNTVLTDCKFEFVSVKTNFIDMEGTGKTLSITNCTATLDGAPAKINGFVGGSKLAQNTLIIRNLTTTDDGIVLSENTVTNVVALYDTADYTGTTLDVPAGVQAIGNYAFSNNNTIETVVLPTSVTDLGRGFDTSSVKKVVLNEGLEVISSRAFRSTSALKEVVIPSTVKEIADNAFQKSAIKEVVIPANVETIGEAAFGSSKIEKVTFEGNTSIQGYAFRGCPNLREVHLKGDNVTFIASTLNGRNSMWFCNGESNNPNTSNITFYVVNKTVAARVKTAMGAEANYTKVYVNGVLYEG